jgi:hypothetical protein
MKTSIIHVVVEDQLSARVAEALIVRNQPVLQVGSIRGFQGFGYIKKNITKFNQAARMMPHLVMTDLDKHPCPVVMKQEWFSVPQHHNLIFRIVVRETEAWLLADRERLAQFLHVSKNRIDRNPESLIDPKRSLIEVAKRSAKRDIREDIVPEGDAKIGPNYNLRLSDFVVNHWDIATARQNAPSLERAIRALETFKPV